MLVFSFSAIILVLCLVYSQGFYFSNQVLRSPLCYSRSKPCRLRVMVGNNNGSLIETSSIETCTCSPPNNCSSDWDRPGHVISRKVISNVYNITLQMMFCQYVEPQRLCRRNNIALVVKGVLLMPQDISSYNCRCRRRQPLLLHQRSIERDHLTYHKYVCANHKPYCSQNATCLRMDSAKTDYLCKCPYGLHCRTQAESSDRITFGYCEP